MDVRVSDGLGEVPKDMASSDEPIRPEVSMEASVCPSLPLTFKSSLDALYHLSQTTYTPETICTRAIDHPRVSAYDLAEELTAALPTHEPYNFILEDKDSMRETHLFYGAATANPLPRVHKTSEASALRHRHPIQYEQAFSHVQKRNIEQDTALVSSGTSIIGGSLVRHSAMYQLPRTVRLWPDDFAAARFAIACIWRQSCGARKPANGVSICRRVIEFVGRLLQIFDGNQQLQFAFGNWVRRRIRCTREMKSLGAHNAEIFTTCTPPQLSFASPLDASTRPELLVAPITRAVALKMRESFIHASLKLAQRAISTLSDSTAKKSTKPATQNTRELGSGSAAAYSQESKKRKRNNDDESGNDEMDVGLPQGMLISGDEEAVDGFGTKQKLGKRARRHSKIEIACEYCRGRKIKCGGQKPQCARCQKDGHECVYSDIVRRRGPGKATLARQLLQSPSISQPPVAKKPKKESKSPNPVSSTLAYRIDPVQAAIPIAAPVDAGLQDVHRSSDAAQSTPRTLVDPIEVAHSTTSIALVSNIYNIPFANTHATTHVGPTISSAIPATTATITDNLPPLTAAPSDIADITHISTLYQPPPTRHFVQGTPVDQFPAATVSRILADGASRNGGAVSPAFDSISTDEEMDDWEPTTSESLSWLSVMAPEVTKEHNSPDIPDDSGLGCFDVLDPIYSSGYVPSDGILNRSNCVSPFLTYGNEGFMEEDDMFTRYGNEAYPAGLMEM